jgi:hypothetical protein
MKQLLCLAITLFVLWCLPCFALADQPSLDEDSSSETRCGSVWSRPDITLEPSLSRGHVNVVVDLDRVLAGTPEGFSLDMLRLAVNNQGFAVQNRDALAEGLANIVQSQVPDGEFMLPADVLTAGSVIELTLGGGLDNDVYAWLVVDEGVRRLVPIHGSPSEDALLDFSEVGRATVVATGMVSVEAAGKSVPALMPTEVEDPQSSVRACSAVASDRTPSFFLLAAIVAATFWAWRSRRRGTNLARALAVYALFSVGTASAGSVSGVIAFYDARNHASDLPGGRVPILSTNSACFINSTTCAWKGLPNVEVTIHDAATAPTYANRIASTEADEFGLFSFGAVDVTVSYRLVVEAPSPYRVVKMHPL